MASLRINRLMRCSCCARPGKKSALIGRVKFELLSARGESDATRKLLALGRLLTHASIVQAVSSADLAAVRQQSPFAQRRRPRAACPLICSSAPADPAQLSPTPVMKCE
uniref:Uncharacterized protein n=1 Tax=Plectus sambesii TaxID=2011161 RepID=A0A914WXA9_9BILA